MKVDQTQFIRPNGRQILTRITVDDKCQTKYADILDCGARLTIELLMNDTVSQTIECSEFDFDIVLTKSDSDSVKSDLEQMIMRFDKEDCLCQQAQMSQALSP